MNSGSLLATCGTIAVACVLIAWQMRGEKGATRQWLGWAAVSLELLAGSMAVYWAVGNGQGILTVVFIFGFVGLALAKATIVSALTTAYEQGKNGAMAVATLSLLGAYFIVYMAGAFHGGMESAGRATVEAEASAPVRALDAQLEVEREKLTGLSGFADSGRASNESAKAQQLQAQLSEAKSALYACPANYITNCINPAQQRVDKIRGQLNNLNYHTGNENYSGTKQLIADLESQRAALLSSGGGTASAKGTGADDAMVAWILDVSVEQARDLKWLVFVLAFDVLSLLFRFTGDLVSTEVDDNALRARRVKAMVMQGVSMQEIGRIIEHEKAALPAPDKPPETVPSKADTPRGTVKKTWNDGLAKHRIESPSDPAMNRTADPEQIDRITQKGVSKSVPDTVLAKDTVPEKSVSVDPLPESVPPQGVPAGFFESMAYRATYNILRNKILNADIRPTVRPIVSGVEDVMKDDPNLFIGWTLGKPAKQAIATRILETLEGETVEQGKKVALNTEQGNGKPKYILTEV